MSGHDRYDSRSRRGVWTHWVPLAVTVGAAAVGLAVWMLSQRRDEDSEDATHHHNGAVAEQQQQQQQQQQRRPDNDYEPEYEPGHTRAPPGSHEAGVQPAGAAVSAANESGEWGVRVSRMLGRTPSPVGAILDSAGRKVVAGVAAAGAVMGNALAAIREEDRSPTAFADHETWSEEADAAAKSATSGAPAAATTTSTTSTTGATGASNSRSPGTRRRTVAVVVSAEGHVGDGSDGGFLEHASMLSLIPRHTDFSRTKLFVLIYAPALKQAGGIDSTSNHPPRSISSSYSNIGPDQVETPSEDPKNPFSEHSPHSAYHTIRNQALALVEDKSMILPFTTPNGYAYMLRHLEPEVDVIYLQESLSGDNGSLVAQLQSWFRHEIILVVGADDGDGGLADSDDDDNGPSKDVWWQKPERVGRGRGVVVVDGMRVADDWARRVQGTE